MKQKWRRNSVIKKRIRNERNYVGNVRGERGKLEIRC